MGCFIARSVVLETKYAPMLMLLVGVCCIRGIICSNICEQQIKIAEPRHSLSENNDKIFVLSLDQSMNTTKCLWNFSTTSNFLLNLIFLNYTSLLAPAGSGCKTDYYLIRTFDLDTNTTSVSGPFCGQRQHGIRINGIISIELVAQKLQYVVGLSLAVLIEASSKECGGIITKPTGGLSVNFDSSNFGITSSNFVHCVWNFELNIPLSFQLFLSKFTIYHDNHYRCVSYNEYLSIRSWNATNGEQREETFECQKFNYKLPMIIKFSKSYRFALIFHSERYYGKIGKITGMALLTSTDSSKSPLEVDGNGNVTYNKLFKSNDTAKEVSVITSLKPHSTKFQVFGVIDMAAVNCKSVQFEIWYIEDDVFRLAANSCSSSSNMEFAIFKAKTMAIVYIRAQESLLKDIRVLFFSSREECGGLFSVQKRPTISIFSPRTASGNYPPNMYCQWTVLAPQSSTLNVSFAYMDIEDCSINFYDYIEIYQGFRRNLELQTKTCTNTVKNFNITGDVTIRFHSDTIDHRAGFNIIVSNNPEEHGKTLTTTTTMATTTATSTRMRLLTSTLSAINSTTQPSISKTKCCKTKPLIPTKDHSDIKSQKHSEKTFKTSSRTENSDAAEKLYAVGISFGTLAFILLVITAVVHFRSRKNGSSKAPYFISNEMYQSNACVEDDSNNSKRKFEEIPMEPLYDYAQPKSSTQEHQQKEHTYEYAKTLDNILGDNGEIVYERMDTMTYQCHPKNIPVEDQYECPTSTLSSDKSELAFLESPEKTVKCPDNDIGLAKGVIYQQPNGTDNIYTIMDGAPEAVYSSVPTDEYVAPDHL